MVDFLIMKGFVGVISIAIVYVLICLAGCTMVSKKAYRRGKRDRSREIEQADREITKDLLSGGFTFHLTFITKAGNIIKEQFNTPFYDLTDYEVNLPNRAKVTIDVNTLRRAFKQANVTRDKEVSILIFLFHDGTEFYTDMEKDSHVMICKGVVDYDTEAIVDIGHVTVLDRTSKETTKAKYYSLVFKWADKRSRDKLRAIIRSKGNQNESLREAFSNIVKFCEIFDKEEIASKEHRLAIRELHNKFEK